MKSRHRYPRPQFRRDNWQSLNGPWEFSLDAQGRWKVPSQVDWNATIEVPYSPETPLSGVGFTGFFHSCWYRRKFEKPDMKPGERLILHFGAVDYSATVWVNGSLAVRHHGGYTPFSVDITELLAGSSVPEIAVCAEDDPFDLAKPRGKQDWLEEPHAIWYHRTSGIWQTVWLEKLPATSIGRIRWTPNLELWEMGFEMRAEGMMRDDLRFSVKLHIGESLLAHDTYEVVAGEVSRRIVFSDPGIDDYRNDLLWSPASPTLITAELELWGKRGDLVDKAWSYTALRSLDIQGDRMILNGRPYPLRFVLDQGYWPESGLTAPDDAALRRDVELTKAMGFNGVRKHQKIEDPRYLYWADRLGLLVWEEMPSAYRFTRTSVERLTREWIDAMNRDYSHPCIVAWVPFNESWGVPNLPELPEQRHYVQGVYHLTKTLDPSRPVVGNDGWESTATDIIGIHDYDDQPDRIARRYEGDERIPHLFKRERPGGKLLTLEGHHHTGQPIMITEFGGISHSDSAGAWGHSRVESADHLAAKYRDLLESVRSLNLIAGFCYTQFADTYQEMNGLLYADRTPKFPIEEIAIATCGAKSTQKEQAIERDWKNRMRKYKLAQNITQSNDPFSGDGDQE